MKEEKKNPHIYIYIATYLNHLYDKSGIFKIFFFEKNDFWKFYL